MNVRAGCHPWNGRAKRQERYSLAPKVIDQRLAFGAVGMQGDIHRIAMIESQTVVSRGLT